MRGRGAVRTCTRALAGLGVAAALAAVLAAQPARAQKEPEPGFSFYGVTFGMTKAEIEEHWLPLSGGVYAVSSPAIRQIAPMFDHEGKLYEISFTIDLKLPGDPPPTLTSIAFQDLLNEKWKKKGSGLIVSLATGRDSNQVTIVHERLRDGYVEHLREKLSGLLKP